MSKLDDLLSDTSQEATISVRIPHATRIELVGVCGALRIPRSRFIAAAISDAVARAKEHIDAASQASAEVGP